MIREVIDLIHQLQADPAWPWFVVLASAFFATPILFMGLESWRQDR